MTSSVSRLPIAPRELHHSASPPSRLSEHGNPDSFLSISKEETALRDALKRCKASVVEAAIQYRKTGDSHYLPEIIHGIIERYVERDLQAKLAGPSQDLRLVEDLGIDSLTMMEIVLLSEEALKITIDNDDLLPLRTVGDIQRFVAGKVADHSLWRRNQLPTHSPLLTGNV